jgi:predicted amidohydrolase YtcJ
MEMLLLHNGRVVTADPEQPRAEALLIEDGRIADVGSDAELLRKWGSVPRRDLVGRAVTPGFNDNHLHAVSGGHHFGRPQLYDMDAGQIVDLLKKRYADARPGDLLSGFGWDYTACPAPHRRILDEAFPHNPVILYQFSGHGMWANSEALKRMRIDRDTPDPPTGTIMRDADGEPTGVLREIRRSNRYLKKMWARRNRHKPIIQAGLERVLEEYRRLGITSVQDNTWFPRVASVLRRLRRTGRLTCRFTCWFYGEHARLVFLMRLGRFDEHLLRAGPYKYFLDGTFSTRSAWLTEPYADEPDTSGKGTDSRHIAKFLERHVQKNHQVACHAIGDRATKEFLDAVEELRVRYPQITRLRLRIEHGQIIRPEDIPRLRDLGVLVAAQPHALGTPQKDITLLGKERAPKAYCYRSLLDGGVHLSFGSDFPGEPTLNPLLGMHYAVNREGPEGITPEEALACYTRESAYAEFAESNKGTLSVGKLADLVMLSDDPTRVPKERIKDITVETTMVGGRIVYEKTDG